MYVEPHERRSSHLKELHRASPVNRREPGLVIKLDVPLLPEINVVLGKPPATSHPPAATSASAHTPPPPANTPTPTPTQAPVSSPSPSSPPSTGGGTGPSNPSPGEGNTGGSNGGGSGNEQPAPSVPQGNSGGQNPTPSSTPGGAGGSTGGTGNGGGDGGGDIPNGSDSSDAGSGSSNPNGGIDGGGGNNLGSSFPGSSNVDSGQGTSNSATDSSGAPVANAGGVPGVESGGGSSGTTTLNSGMTTIRLSPSGTQNGPSPTHTNTGGEDGGASRGGLPQAAGIAIAVICSILFLIGLILLLRRHRKARRDERIHRWWFTKKRTSRVYNDDKVHVVQMPAPQSARSSFATTFDRSAQFQVNFNSDVPSLPPTAEVRRSRNELDYPMASPTNESGDPRFSIGSSNSGNSNYFFIDHRPSIDTANSHQPANPNPFHSSPERFAFPKPPSDITSDRKSGYSSSSVASTTRPVSRDTNTDSKNYHTPDTSPSPPEHQNLPAINADPFADGIEGAPRSTSSHTTDPFSDSTVSASHETSGEGAVLAEVLRPFTRSMPDELTVRPGDQVKVLQVFDDGWAIVVTVPSSSSSEARYERGLVPLGCLR